MGFLHKDSIKSLEGKFLKWSDGETRILELVSHDRVDKTFNGETRTIDEITVIDKDTGEEKVFSANKKFLNGLAKMDDQLKPSGNVIKVTPLKYEMTLNDGREITTFDFDIELLEDSSNPL